MGYHRIALLVLGLSFALGLSAVTPQRETTLEEMLDALAARTAPFSSLGERWPGVAGILTALAPASAVAEKAVGSKSIGEGLVHLKNIVTSPEYRELVQGFTPSERIAFAAGQLLTLYLVGEEARALLSHGSVLPGGALGVIWLLGLAPATGTIRALLPGQEKQPEQALKA
jgi:hypothetical protein